MGAGYKSAFGIAVAQGIETGGACASAEGDGERMRLGLGLGLRAGERG